MENILMLLVNDKFLCTVKYYSHYKLLLLLLLDVCVCVCVFFLYIYIYIDTDHLHWLTLFRIS